MNARRIFESVALGQRPSTDLGRQRKRPLVPLDGEQRMASKASSLRTRRFQFLGLWGSRGRWMSALGLGMKAVRCEVVATMADDHLKGTSKAAQPHNQSLRMIRIHGPGPSGIGSGLQNRRKRTCSARTRYDCVASKPPQSNDQILEMIRIHGTGLSGIGLGDEESTQTVKCSHECSARTQYDSVASKGPLPQPTPERFE